MYASDLSPLAAALTSNSGRFLLTSSVSVSLGLVLLTFNSIAQASLIWATAQSLRWQTVTLRESLRQGTQFLKPFLFVTLVLFGPLYLISLLLSSTLLSINPKSGTFLLITLALGFSLISLIVTVLHQLAQRAIVLQAQGVRASIANGWQVFRRYTRQWIITLICLMVVAVFYALAMGIILLPFATASLFPALFAWIQTGSISTSQILAVVGSCLLALALFAPMNAFLSIGITLAYYRLNRLDLPKRKRERLVRA